jgi:hypothetical protein
MLIQVTKTWNSILVDFLKLTFFCVLDHLYRITGRCLPPHVKLNIILILLLSKIVRN